VVSSHLECLHMGCIGLVRTGILRRPVASRRPVVRGGRVAVKVHRTNGTNGIDGIDGGSSIVALLHLAIVPIVHGGGACIVTPDRIPVSLSAHTPARPPVRPPATLATGSKIGTLLCVL
jgi:hypothetical protein